MDTFGRQLGVNARSTPFERDFFGKLRDFCRLVKRFGVDVEPLSSAGVAKFREIDEPGRRAIVENFYKYAGLLESAVNSGIDLRMERDLLVYVLPRIGLSASQDALDTIENGHIIEVYTADHIQIFRNIEFMSYCNYTLIDLLTYTFFDLYERAAIVTNKLIEASTKIFTTDVDVLNLKEEFPNHVLRERFAEPRAEFVLDMKYLWPLYAGPGNRKGLLSMSKVVSTTYIGDEKLDNLSFI